jgi:N-acetylmuramoyl-L-alanine amidase
VSRRSIDRRRLLRLRRAVAFLGLVVIVAVGVLAWRTVGPDVIRLEHRIRGTDTASSGGTPLDTAAFSPGACQAFAPTDGDNGRTVFLDAGHGGIDPGGSGTTEAGTTIYEAGINLAIELDAMALLRARGYRVVVSRTGNTSVVRLSADDISDGVLSLQGSHDDVVARDECANLAKADALVGIYMDSGAAPDNAGSVTIYDTDRTFSQTNSRLAGLLENDVLAAMNDQGWDIPNDGAVSDTGYGSAVGDPSAGGLAEEALDYNHLLLIGPAQTGYFTSPSDMPGAVIEPLYLTDPFEGSIAENRGGQKVIAQGVATAVEQFLIPSKKSG